MECQNAFHTKARREYRREYILSSRRVNANTGFLAKTLKIHFTRRARREYRSECILSSRRVNANTLFHAKARRIHPSTVVIARRDDEAIWNALLRTARASLRLTSLSWIPDCFDFYHSYFSREKSSRNDGKRKSKINPSS
jgi:hypothetical protein